MDEIADETYAVSELAAEFTDERGLHVLCGCGHYVSGGVTAGKKIDFCPNCWLILHVTGTLAIPRPDRLTDETRAKSTGPLPDAPERTQGG